MTNLIQNLLRALDVGRLQVDFIVLICWCQVNPDLVSCDLNSDPRTALKMNGLHCTALHGGVFSFFFLFCFDPFCWILFPFVGLSKEEL